MNRLNEDELYELSFRVCIAVVKESFNHIPVERIISPNHGEFDAYLARQIVLHLLVHEFGLVRTRIGKLIEVRRTALNASIRTIDNRLDDEDFAAQYRLWASRAKDLYLDKLAEAA
ncbi:hypothetical protein SAMN04515647_1587 [Cohaesibacter sp. ES.047]|uniref:hypothetical protein n=1 Tax=Cohaesibacter sp. ES.047 TaxID=1798205 RepID=UPI000BB892F7|nr:hypothetical protein [Cohaesibacter sp. ES.047]SNY91366.1 hypothetical protein SAMN04515647_1587 [Cohaesibacter sp. ES.047]